MNDVNFAKPFHRVSLAVIALVVTLGLTQAARADDFAFTISNGAGISASGVIGVTPGGVLGSSTVSSITGTFTDSTNHISGAITGLEFAPAPTLNPGPTPIAGTFSPPGAVAGLTFDNLFWAAGDSPSVCPDVPFFSGGDFDIYGMAFDVDGGLSATGGSVVDVWSNGDALGGYQLNDSSDGSPNSPSNIEGLAYAVTFAAAPTPEPGSLALLGTGLSGIAALWRRRKASL